MKLSMRPFIYAFIASAPIAVAAYAFFAPDQKQNSWTEFEALKQLVVESSKENLSSDIILTYAEDLSEITVDGLHVCHQGEVAPADYVDLSELLERIQSKAPTASTFVFEQLAAGEGITDCQYRILWFAASVP